jgi:hypothetical protein
MMMQMQSGNWTQNTLSLNFGNKSPIAHVLKTEEFDALTGLRNKGGANKSEDLYENLSEENWKCVS